MCRPASTFSAAATSSMLRCLFRSKCTSSNDFVLQCVYACVSVCVCAYACACACVLRASVCAYACACAYMLCVCRCIPTCICTHTHTHTHTCMCLYMHVYMHMHIYPYIYIFTFEHGKSSAHDTYVGAIWLLRMRSSALESVSPHDCRTSLFTSPDPPRTLARLLSLSCRRSKTHLPLRRCMATRSACDDGDGSAHVNAYH